MPAATETDEGARKERNGSAIVFAIFLLEVLVLSDFVSVLK